MHILEIPSFFPPYGGEFCLEQARALQALGHEVRTLKRIRIVNIELGALKPGQQRKIEGEELQELYETVMTQHAGKKRK